MKINCSDQPRAKFYISERKTINETVTLILTTGFAKNFCLNRDTGDGYKKIINL